MKKNKTAIILTISFAFSGFLLTSLLPLIIYKGGKNSDFIDPALEKSKLMRNQLWNLSSMNNIDDDLASSIKQNVTLAISENYPVYNVDDISLDFYYGSSLTSGKKEKIEFKTNGYETILFFNVEISSKNNKFKKSTIDFDFRPELPRDDLIEDYQILYLNKQIKTSSWETFFASANKTLTSLAMKESFELQWEKMGIKADGFMNDDGYDAISFNSQMIKEISLNNIFIDNQIQDISFIEKLSNNLKAKLFKTNEKTVVIKRDFWKIKSKGIGSNLENNLRIFGLDDNKDGFFFGYSKSDLEGKKLSDYTDNFKNLLIAKVFEKTNHKLNFSDFTLSYASSWDPNNRIVYKNDTLIDDILNQQPTIWIDLVSIRNNILVDYSGEPGFRVNIIKEGGTF